MVELIWEGKYDAAGRRVAPPRIALPFQTVETVNESAQERQSQFDLFATGRDPAWRNRLIWGDKKYVLPSLLPEFAGKVDLVYIDPPFDTGADFSFTAQIPDNPDTDEDESATFTKQPGMLEVKAYRDIWGKGGTHLDSYLAWFYETVGLLRQLLSPNGSLYVHCDSRVNSYLRAVLDEVVGAENLVNHITWRRTGAHNDPGRYGMITDTILFYAMSQNYTWNPLFAKRSDESLATSFAYAEGPNGTVVRLSKGEEPKAGWRRLQSVTLRSPHPRPNLTYDYKGYRPHRNGWSVSIDRMKRYDQENRLIFPESKDGAIRLKMYLDESPGIPVQDLWADVGKIEANSTENLNYPTQKPEALVDRIISASSNLNDLVLDCFSGSGTTAAVAEKLGRRWITADLGRFAIHTTRKRLLAVTDVKPFAVQNLGKYERQAWQVAEFGEREDIEARQLAYRNFILQLYKADPVEASQWIHGRKSGRWVHVGAVDSPISTQDVTSIANNLKQLDGAGNRVDVLGWDFAFDLNETAKQQAARAGLDFSFKVIPREVLEKRAVEQGDIQFFELGALGANTDVEGQRLTVTLTDLIVRQDDIPAEVRGSITHWSQMLDYWAIDWDFRNDTFHNQWQSYRTRKDPKLDLKAAHTYEEPGDYRVMIKAIDILGNDTTKVVEVTVP